ncbi:transposase domain-containing protein [Pararhodobacter zhoushanensis]|uniref:Mu transposase C-terminal domain-containing protein n=1 Tax=Pararhodobacter zhoushanensis TaxID=2479545 RepID=A0ABT3H2M5_9RHOB|nr:transposase domain-containing protein [Pararhodobacter zhoushanensis]MCW1934094.1 Mu transposase C-terminal domain-containing protein [Pararhodobacter zhoushanensis]
MSDLAPAKLWWTANELADALLPDVPATQQGVERWAKRVNLRANSQVARRRSGRGGGWEYHWTALPLAARKALLIDASVPAQADAVSRGQIWTWFEELPDTVQDKAKHRLTCVQAIEALERGLGRDLAIKEVARLKGVSARTLWNWMGMVEGVRTDDRLPHLAPKHRAVARKVTRAEFDEEFFDWLAADYLRLERPSFSSSYRRAERVARQNSWVTAPERTMRRYLDARISQPGQILARMGLDALKRMYPPQRRDKTALHALEVVNGDFHKFDVFVRWPGIDAPVRPQMVAWQDVYSGRVLSWRLDLTANARAVMLAAGDMIEDWGIPEHILLDNGREFAAKEVTGGSETRNRFKHLEADIPGLFTALGCEIHWATPYAGQSKPIERAFRDMCDAIAKDPRFAGAWTGNKPEAKPENYASKAVPFDDFLRVVSEGIEEHNLRQGRRSEIAWGRSFAEVFAESYETSAIRKATEAQRRFWLMGAKGLRVHKTTAKITFMGNEYWSEWLHGHAGERVIVRFDPADLHGGIHVYGFDNAYLGTAACHLPAGFLSIDAAREHNRARKDWMKAERKALDAHRKLSARELGVDLDAVAPTDAAPDPQAKVVRPMFNAKPRVDATPAPRPEVEAAQATVVADLAARRAPKVADETPKQRFGRALELERAVEAGGIITEAQAHWLRVYQSTPEYRAEHMLWSDFGDAYFG